MKKIQILILLLAVFVIAINTKGFSKSDEIRRNKKSHKPVQINLKSKQNRLLSNLEAQKMRITFDFSALNTIQNQSIKKFLQENIKVTAQFFSDLIKVKYPITQPFRIPQDQMSCDGYTYSEEQKTMEFKDSDLHILVSFIDNPVSQYLAYAGGCISDDTGRFIVGIVNFNIGFMTSFTDYDFYNQLGTTQHELFHVIAFNNILYPYFEISKGVKYPEEDYSNEWNLLKFPEVQKWARSHYNCQDLEGMPVENEGSSLTAGTHWEKAVIQEEIMNADGDDGFWSDLNNALMTDSGWYEVDRSYKDMISYGKNQGCDFVQNQCKSKKQYKEFCTKLGVSGPSPSYHAASVCAQDQFTNGCYTMEPKKICLNTTNNDLLVSQQYQEQYGYNSRVFISTLAASEDYLGIVSLMCYKSECIGDSQINVYFDNSKLECKTDFEIINSPNKKFKGYLKCPEIKDFCSKQQRCPQFCSSKGYCIKGECVCKDGYSGPGCQCPPNQFYDANIQACSKCADEINCTHCDSSNSSVCKECKNGFYLQNGQCKQCSDSCKTCNLSADNCLSCQAGFNLKNNQCSQCPQLCENCSSGDSQICINCFDGYGFDIDNQCTLKCSNNCKTCNGSQNNCLTCKEGMYLKDGKCLCQEGTYFDQQSNTCKQCTYLCKKCSNGNSCDLCVDTYTVDPKTNNCGKCQDKFFENSNGKCVACNFSCEKCSGSATTCSKCNDDSYLNSQNKCVCKILNQYMDKEGTCVNCKQGCKTCVSLNKCTSCEENFYLKRNKCLTCPQGKYVNLKGKCKPCDSSCSKCTGPLPSQCKP